MEIQEEGHSHRLFRRSEILSEGRFSSLVVGVLLLTAPIMASSGALEKVAVNGEAEIIQRALSAFLTAFDNPDWQASRACFGETATAFHPSPPVIKGIDSRDQFEKAWLAVFDKVRKSSGRTSPPYIKLDARDLRIEPVSDDVNLVTFHLISGNMVGRQTFVFKRFPDGWKFVHVHGSILTAP